MKYILGLGALLLMLNSNVQAQKTAQTTAVKLANKYGVKKFKNVNNLAYTFNVQRDTTTTSRSWNWDVKRNIITMTTPKEKVTYQRDTITTKEMKAVDARFINDQYWLLFPFHVVWDAGTTLTLKEDTLSPIGKQKATMLTVQYNKVGGYSPGDAYDLFIDKNYTLLEWVFRSGGAVKPSLMTTWESTIKAKGLSIATNHVNETGKFRIFFTGVTVD